MSKNVASLLLQLLFPATPVASHRRFRRRKLNRQTEEINVSEAPTFATVTNYPEESSDTSQNTAILAPDPEDEKSSTQASYSVLELLPFTVDVPLQYDTDELTGGLEVILLEGIQNSAENILSVDLIVESMEENQILSVQYSAVATFEGSSPPSEILLVDTEMDILNDKGEKTGVLSLRFGDSETFPNRMGILTAVQGEEIATQTFEPENQFEYADSQQIQGTKKEVSDSLIISVGIGAFLSMLLAIFLGYKYWATTSSSINGSARKESIDNKTYETMHPTLDALQDTKNTSRDTDDFSIDYSLDGESVFSNSANSDTQRSKSTENYLKLRAQQRKNITLEQQNMPSHPDDLLVSSEPEFTFDLIATCLSTDNGISEIDSVEGQGIEVGLSCYSNEFENSMGSIIIDDNPLVSLTKLKNSASLESLPFDEKVEAKKIAINDAYQIKRTEQLEVQEEREIPSAESFSLSPVPSKGKMNRQNNNNNFEFSTSKRTPTGSFAIAQNIVENNVWDFSQSTKADSERKRNHIQITLKEKRKEQGGEGGLSEFIRERRRAKRKSRQKVTFQ